MRATSRVPDRGLGLAGRPFSDLAARAAGRVIAARLASPRRRACLLGEDRVRERLDELRRAGRRVVFGYWTEQVLPLVLASRALAAHASQGKLLDVEFICDDSFPGQVTAEILRRGALRPRVIHARRPAARMRDMQRLIASPEPFGIAVDGTGPWGRVSASLPRFLEECRAVAVPLIVAGDFATVRLRTRLAVPRPGGRLALAVGDAVDFSAGRGSVDDLAAAFDRAQLDAEVCVRGERVGHLAMGAVA